MLSLQQSDAFSLSRRRYGDDAKPAASLATIPQDDPGDVRDAQEGRFDRRVPGGVARAVQSMLPRMKPACFYDIVMQVAIIPPGADPGRHDPSVPAPPQRARGGDVSASQAEAGARAQRSALLPLFQEQGMRMAIRGPQASRRGRADPTAAARWATSARATAWRKSIRSSSRAWCRTASTARRRSSSSTCSKASPTTASPNRTRRASRCSHTRTWAYVKCHEPGDLLRRAIPQRAADGLLLDGSADQRRSGATAWW